MTIHCHPASIQTKWSMCQPAFFKLSLFNKAQTFQTKWPITVNQNNHPDHESINRPNDQCVNQLSSNCPFSIRPRHFRPNDQLLSIRTIVQTTYQSTAKWSIYQRTLFQSPIYKQLSWIHFTLNYIEQVDGKSKLFEQFDGRNSHFKSNSIWLGL